jgi:predicted dithiol-disulfide oxidoreductase (DUF899 family)
MSHSIVGHQEWLNARTAFLAMEGEITGLREEPARERRQLPWQRIETPYNFMFGPDWQKGRVRRHDKYQEEV